ncbi:hypothetical protein K449DRAFT_402668 [Hypoxylon sp. EC38]|nr:hypothetical protein K449DRAFT_402668 [Hypoxylon sp. EC38]
MTTFYEFSLFGMKERFQIDDGTWNVLRIHDDFKANLAPLNLLVTAVDTNRISLLMVASRLDDTARASAGSGDDTATSALAILHVIHDILGIANRARQPPRLETLPLDIRQRIYRHYFNTPSANPLVPIGPQANGFLGCNCSNPSSQNLVPGRQTPLDISLALTNKAIMREALGYLYTYRTVYFPCACNMAYHIRSNPILNANLIRVKFHWTGMAAPDGIQDLNQMPIISLTVVISDHTTMFLTANEQQMRRYFMSRRNTNALPGALGMFELLQLRDVPNVHVEQIAQWRGEPRCEADRHGLTRLLRDTITQPRV